MKMNYIEKTGKIVKIIIEGELRINSFGEELIYIAENNTSYGLSFYRNLGVVEITDAPEPPLKVGDTVRGIYSSLTTSGKILHIDEYKAWVKWLDGTSVLYSLDALVRIKE